MQETVETGPNPKDIEAVQTLIKTILRVQSKVGAGNSHRPLPNLTFS